MARLDDNELNIHPEVAAALGYLRPEVFAEASAPPRRTVQSDVTENQFGGLWEGIEGLVGILLGIFGVVVVFVAALLVFVILVWLYTLFTITPQQRQLGMSQTPRGQRLHTPEHTGRLSQLAGNMYPLFAKLIPLIRGIP